VEKVLICVKTYPTLSSKYKELVCTAGFRENGTWIRLYPIPFRMLKSENQYAKWQWIHLDLVKNENDDRAESFRPVNPKNITLGYKIPADGGPWRERRRFAMGNVQHNLNELVKSAKQEGGPSLATFKPYKVIDFFWKEEKNPKWSDRQLASVLQGDLFEEDQTWFKEVTKLPFKFYYHFLSSNGTDHKLMIEDWELGALYWKYAEQGSHIACQKVKQKYFDDFAKTKDLHFFLGTTKRWHKRGRNPFVIIGTFHGKHMEPELIF